MFYLCFFSKVEVKLEFKQLLMTPEASSQSANDRPGRFAIDSDGNRARG
jgi:hypothetical protein